MSTKRINVANETEFSWRCGDCRFLNVVEALLATCKIRDSGLLVSFSVLIHYWLSTLEITGWIKREQFRIGREDTRTPALRFRYTDIVGDIVGNRYNRTQPPPGNPHVFSRRVVNGGVMNCSLLWRFVGLRACLQRLVRTIPIIAICRLSGGSGHP